MNIRILLAAAALAALGAGAASAQSLSLPSTPLGATTAYATLGYTWEDRNTRLSPNEPVSTS